jgi:hypothetical protein
MAEHNPQHGRRPHFHRGRRGPDRRGTERRVPPRESSPDGGREQNRESRDGGVDVEQVMREIRARISQRHGIELSTQQIQELAARRLEAILEPRNVKPQLLEQLRRSTAPEVPTAQPLDTYEFDDATLFETHRGILRFLRRVLSPILKLFFNPTPLVQALNKQARINKELAAREVEREQRQSEWNALQYELLQRMVLETSRISIEMQALVNRIESLSTKVDFNERRVRSMESTAAPAARPHRPLDTPAVSVPSPAASGDGGSAEPQPAEGVGEGTRRRRRRRRGRRSGSPGEVPAVASTAAAIDDDNEADDGEEEDVMPAAALQPAAVTPVPAAPPIEPMAPAAPTPPRDEPLPQDPVDKADPGPVDR